MDDIGFEFPDTSSDPVAGERYQHGRIEKKFVSRYAIYWDSGIFFDMHIRGDHQYRMSLFVEPFD
jgi:hypothetical protein